MFSPQRRALFPTLTHRYLTRVSLRGFRGPAAGYVAKRYLKERLCLAAKRLFRVCVVTLMIAPATPVFAYEPLYEHIPARQLLPDDILSGSHYRINPDVVNRGLMNHYQIESKFGVFQADSNKKVEVRIREVEALAQLAKIHEGSLMAKSVGKTVVKTFVSVGQVAMNPEETVEGVGDGLERLFNRSKRRLKNAYEDVKQAVAERGGNGEDAGDGGDRNFSDKAGDAAVSFGKRRLGIRRAYRSLAKKVGVDPYTDNEVLKAELERLANYSAGASVGSRLFIPRIPTVISYVKDVSDLVWEKDRLDLILYNESVLKRLGVPPDVVKAFIDNEAYTPTTQTFLVASLAQLSGVQSLDVVMSYAIGAETRPEAEFYTNFTGLLVGYHERRSDFHRVLKTDTIIPLMLTRDQRAVAIIPVDRLRWTEDIARLFLKLDNAYRGTIRLKETWVPGNFSEMAKREVNRRGWIDINRAESRLNL